VKKNGYLENRRGLGGKTVEAGDGRKVFKSAKKRLARTKGSEAQNREGYERVTVG